MRGSSCFWIIFLVIVFFIAVIIVGAILLYRYLDNSYENLLSLECEQWGSDSLSIPDLTQFENNTYQPNNALSLLIINFNTTMSHCGNIEISLPSQFSIIETIESGGTSFGYFLYSATLKMSLITFTGSYGVSDWLFDSNITQVSPSGIPGATGMVHSGFYSIYKSIQISIHSKLKKYESKTDVLVITGHSLGGALATLCAYGYAHKNPFVYTFGSPRVGNPDFSNAFNSLYGIIQGDSSEIANVWRVANDEDLVTELPPSILTPSILYQHVGVPHSFSINLGSYTNNHNDAYIQGLEEEI